MPYISFKEIFAEQNRTLDYKIESAIKAIQSGYDVCVSKPSIAFSGGKDSTVLWHLIKTHFTKENANTAVIFGNTGVEFPESLKFARELGESWGGDNFYEATPEPLKCDELKYEAQCEVLQYFIDTNQLYKILKSDGKLKTTHTLMRLCPSDTVYAERYTNHRKVAGKHGIAYIDFDCGFENTKGVWLNRKEAFIVALFYNQIKDSGLKFTAQRLCLGYDLRETHPGLDSMWLKTDDEGYIVTTLNQSERE